MSDYMVNSFQVPNILVDELIATISPNALKCYLIIIRKTIGWSKEWDKISTTQLMGLSGIKKKDTVHRAIKELEVKNLIETIKENGKLTLYKPVPKKGTGTKNSSTFNGYPTSTKKGYSTKHTNKTHNNKITEDKEKAPIEEKADTKIQAYRKFISIIKSKVPIKNKVNYFINKNPEYTEKKCMARLREILSDTKKEKFIADYINHQKEEGNFSKNIHIYIESYLSYYKDETSNNNSSSGLTLVMERY